MDIRFIRSAALYVSLVLSFISCATPTISNKITLASIAPEKVGVNGLSDVYLIGGEGLDWARKVICSSDGSCILFGQSLKSFGETTDYLAVQVSPENKLVWSKTYGGTYKDELDTAIATSDGGYLLVGSSQSLFFTPLKVFNTSKPPRPFIVKINSSGDLQWVATVDRGLNFLSDVVQTRDGGYVFVGAAPLVTDKDKKPNVEIAMIKVSNNGEQVWANRYDLGTFSASYRLIELRDGSLILSGYTRQIAGDIDALILKADSNGNPLWTKIYLTELDQWPLSLVEASQGGFLTVGFSQSNETGRDLFASRLSSTGALIWSKTYEGQKNSEALNIIEGYHDKFLILGRMGDINEKKQSGIAILIDNEGKMMAMTALGNETELMSAAKLPHEKYRLVGDTADFQATYADVLAITWSPESAGKPAGETSEFSPRSLKTQEQDAQLKAAPIELMYTLLPLKLLEVQTLSVGEDIKATPKVP